MILPLPKQVMIARGKTIIAALKYIMQILPFPALKGLEGSKTQTDQAISIIFGSSVYNILCLVEKNK